MTILSRLVLLFGVVNAILYSSLLPLWEGFDEAFHYAYVQHVSTHGSLLVLNQTPVSEEIWQSLQVQPVSHYIQESAQAPYNFKDYFALTNDQRSALRQRLDSIPPDSARQPHPGLLNYEAYQAPLPYLYLALPDRILSGLPITWRVLLLRLLLSVTAVVLIWFGIALVARQLGLRTEYAAAAAFCVFCSQMLYGVIAHISNDSLAVPAMIFFIWAAIRAAHEPSGRNYSILGATLGLGLVVKAYFLVEVPLAFLLVGWQLWRRRASLRSAGLFLGVLCVVVGPSYVRNLVIYHSIDGTTQLAGGLGIQEAFDAITHIPWLRSIGYMATSAIWTGNNSFTTFSTRTLWVVLLLLAGGIGAYFYSRKRARRVELLVLGSIGFFCAGLFFITLASYHATKGAMIAAVPWYAQVLLAPVMLVVFLGMSRAGSAGRWLAVASVVVWSYLITATYLLKLIPQYGGFPTPNAHLSELFSWYMHDAAQRNAIMSAMLLTPPWWIYAMTCATVLLCFYLCIRFVVRLRSAYLPEISEPRNTSAAGS